MITRENYIEKFTACHNSNAEAIEWTEGVVEIKDIIDDNYPETKKIIVELAEKMEKIGTTQSLRVATCAFTVMLSIESTFQRARADHWEAMCHELAKQEKING